MIFEMIHNFWIQIIIFQLPWVTCQFFRRDHKRRDCVPSRWWLRCISVTKPSLVFSWEWEHRNKYFFEEVNWIGVWTFKFIITELPYWNFCIEYESMECDVLDDAGKFYEMEIETYRSPFRSPSRIMKSFFEEQEFLVFWRKMITFLGKSFTKNNFSCLIKTVLLFLYDFCKIESAHTVS